MGGSAWHTSGASRLNSDRSRLDTLCATDAQLTVG